MTSTASRDVTSVVALVPWSGVPVGRRTVRGAARVQVDLPCKLYRRSYEPARVRLLDLSSSGARFRGPRLNVDETCELSFLPPGRSDAVRLGCRVVRLVPDERGWQVGVAFLGPPLSFRLDLIRP